MSDITNMLDDASEEAIREIKRLRSEVFSLRIEVERLRLTEEERAAIAFFNNAWALEMWKPHGETLRKLLSRLGGGE